jgi:ABC-type transport system substrate-binding protein
MLRVVFRTGAAPLNWFGYSIPEADKLMDQASGSSDATAAVKDYTASAAIIRDAAILENIANNYDVVVTRAGITNVVHDPMRLQTIRIEELKAG